MAVQSLDRAFDILELLAREPQPLTLTDISRQLELHKTTVYRLISSLRDRGYIEKSCDNNMYRLGLGFIELSSLYLNKVEIKTEAQPYLHELSQDLGRTTYLAILQDKEVVYIDKYEQVNSLRKYSIIGTRKPLYSTSLGKALLIDKTEEEIREIFKNIKLKRFTPTTITDLGTLLREIEESRKRGYTRDNQEMDASEQCIGAPIRDYRGIVIAAISAAWKGEFTASDEEKASRLVSTAADAISLRLGYLPAQKLSRVRPTSAV
jgi:IclR family KDG regulon transcriptional repressor